jgi:hypothetical protein
MDMNSAIASSSSSSSPSPSCTLSCIIGSALEATLHEILYTRFLYPRDAFAATRYLAVTCHACRHPGVVQYIRDTLIVAVPALISGFVDELLLVFYDTEEARDGRKRDRVLEKFVFSFDVEAMVHARLVFQQDEQFFKTTSTAHDDESFKTVAQRIQDVQRSMRDVLLKIISMDGTDLGRKRGQTVFTDTATFKICLHRSNVQSDMKRAKMTCEHLQQAMEKGLWISPEECPCDISHEHVEQTKTRPIRSIHVPSCGFKMQLVMESL